MKKIGILVLIGVLSLNSIGLATKKNKVNEVDKNEIISANNENSKKKRSVWSKFLKKKDKDSWELVWNDECDGDSLD